MPIEAISVLEVMIRAAAAGALLILAIEHSILGRGFGVQRLSALFAFGTAAYTIISTPVTWALFGDALLPLITIATFNSLFFWWVSTALFDDDFSWEAWRIAPALLLLVLLVWRILNDWDDSLLRSVIHQGMVIGFMCHVLWLAVANRKDDLVEPRRRFRLVFAFVVGAMGLLIAIGELIIGINPPVWISFAHALALATLVFGFSVWLLQPRDVFSPPRKRDLLRSIPVDISAVDRADLERLDALMRAGIYRREGLTVGELAREVGVPEHRLRQLINGALGFRNFSAFLNSRRIEEAKTVLSNPSHARRQILQIALDLGYGSIAPFNRAFKSMVGLTPTAYRRRSLGDQT
ncbi:MAG: AraC family transcriptional regulator [Pseudomonadota bacterium]